MPVTPQVSYPGVYVQEVPSGVRTIVGVGTSIAMFIGRAKSGPLFEPIQCLSVDDFERNFTFQYASSDLARAVKLFFLNGGTQSYVMRIADAFAASAKVMLKTEGGSNSLEVTARSAGLLGNDIRLNVNYNTLQPEATFNMEVFRWLKTSTGAMSKGDVETYQGLSMDDKAPRYVKNIINQSSKLIQVEDMSPGVASGYSQSGRAVSNFTDNNIFREQWKSLLGKDVSTNRFRISVDGNPFVDVDLSSLDFDAASGPTNPLPLDTESNAVANLSQRIQDVINGNLSGGAQVGVSFVAGPNGPAGEDNQTTQYLHISSDNGDVRIEPAASNDLAVSLMLGAAQGGLEISRYADKRPAPNGIVTNPADLTTFAAMQQDDFDKLVIGTAEIDLSGDDKLTTTDATLVTEPRMYQDETATNANDGRDGIREKWGIIAAAVNGKRSSVLDFGWTAEVWGNRLALIPVSGSDNTSALLSTQKGGAAGPSLGTNLITNVRYYSLGTTGSGDFQDPGLAGNDGGVPALADYNRAYKVIDQEVDLFNIMVLPKDAEHSDADSSRLWGPASVFCQQRRAFLLLDPPAAWTDSQKAVDASVGVNSLRVGLAKDYSAVFFPRVTVNEDGININVGPSGAIAGLMARIDSSRGVWKASAGTEADLRGVVGLEYKFSDGENGVMNPKAVNTLRIFPNGIVAWGARTMDGDDSFASEYKYIPIRRLALFIEESLYRGLKWVVFEPNDEPLWAQIRLNVGAFMHNLFRQGAFQGQTPREAYFVKCDKDTTTQNDRNLGIVNIMVGFAPLKPAEFVIIYLQQMAGQIQV